MIGLKSVVSILAILAGVGSVDAATLVGTGRHATGINDLIVDGTAYNVSFTVDTLNSVYPDPSQMFFSETMSYDAVFSVASFFNSNSVTGIINDSTYEFNVPFANNEDGSFGVSESFNGGHDVGGWSLPRVGRPAGDTNYDHNSVAVFSLSSVPLPPALPMFGAAVLALGAVGYGLKRKGVTAA